MSTYGGWLGRIIGILAPRLSTIESHRVCRSRRLWRIFTACLTMYAIFFSIYTLVCWGGGRSDCLVFFFVPGTCIQPKEKARAGVMGRNALRMLWCLCQRLVVARRGHSHRGSRVLGAVGSFWKGFAILAWCFFVQMVLLHRTGILCALRSSSLVS